MNNAVGYSNRAFVLFLGLAALVSHSACCGAIAVGNTRIKNTDSPYLMHNSNQVTNEGTSKAVMENPNLKNSSVYIENENTKELDILIQPSSGRKMKDAWGEKDLHEGYMTLKVPANTVVRVELNFPLDTKAFSVTGETSAATPSGTCAQLVKGRHYWLRFPNNMFGTACISTEMVGNLPKIVNGVAQRPHPVKQDPYAETAPSALSNSPS